MGRKIYPLNCECCNPPIVLNNYGARKYHESTMSKKRDSSNVFKSDSSSSDTESSKKPAANKSKKQKTVRKPNIFINYLSFQ